jgi:Primase C terminal 2 (PriCT-2)
MIMQDDPQETGYKLAISTMRLTEKIPQGSPIWSRFNASFVNRQVGSYDFASDIYNGFAFTAQHKNNWRTSENYVCSQCLALDFDTCDQHSTLATLKADKFIARYASFLYTTISHTPEAPRARAVFLLDQPIMQAKNYTLAASSLLWVFGTADRQCKDAVRFFYASPGCDLEYLDNVLTLETVKHLIAQYQETGRQEKRNHAMCQFANTPDQQEVSDALRLIPATAIDYDEWLQVLMALHSAYGDAGRGLAESWADGKPGEVDSKWKSFKPGGNTTGTVTIATVFGIAKKFGWKKAA